MPTLSTTCAERVGQCLPCFMQEYTLVSMPCPIPKPPVSLLYEGLTFSKLFPSLLLPSIQGSRRPGLRDSYMHCYCIGKEKKEKTNSTTLNIAYEYGLGPLLVRKTS